MRNTSEGFVNLHFLKNFAFFSGTPTSRNTSQYLPQDFGFVIQRKTLTNYCGFYFTFFNPLSAKPKKLPNTLKQFVGKLPTNCLSVFDHFVGLALKRLTHRKYSSTSDESNPKKEKKKLCSYTCLCVHPLSGHMLCTFSQMNLNQS